MSTIIDRNTTIPVRRSQVFSTAEDNQPAVDIHVLQGEREMARDNRSLGQFKLDGIPAAPRGIPQVEVTFDIDANGILTVSARDKASGKEQTITITGSTALDKTEIERMVRDAEIHSAEDKKRREEVEIRNDADSLAYQVERQLDSLGEKIPTHEKARIEQLLSELKKALKENESKEKIQSLKSDLEQAAYSLSQGAYQQAGQDNESGDFNQTSRETYGSPPHQGDVVDAEFEERP